MRSATIERNTKETSISVTINLEGAGTGDITTGIGFFDHMLDQIARHAPLDLKVLAKGDLHIDGHHSVEDVGIALGQAVDRALGDRKGIARYGEAHAPLDEFLAHHAEDRPRHEGGRKHGEPAPGVLAGHEPEAPPHAGLAKIIRVS